MTKLIMTYVVALFFTSLNAQSIEQIHLPAIEAHFTGIIVKDINLSVKWYTEGLGFKILNRFDSKKRGFSQVKLKTGHTILELIQLNSALELKDIYSNYTKKTRFVGLFKTGFMISKFDNWISHFRKMKLTFHGNVVKDSNTDKRMVILKDPDGNRIQFFEK